MYVPGTLCRRKWSGYIGHGPEGHTSRKLARWNGTLRNTGEIVLLQKQNTRVATHDRTIDERTAMRNGNDDGHDGDDVDNGVGRIQREARWVREGK